MEICENEVVWNMIKFFIRDIFNKYWRIEQRDEVSERKCFKIELIGV